MFKSFPKIKVEKKSSLIAALDKVFSNFIRLRDAGILGYCKCITCNNIFPWNEMDAGHFMPRGKMATRYNEMNVNAQCRKCNRLPKFHGKAGEQYLHGRAIDIKYGTGTADSIQILSTKKAHLDIFFFKESIKIYRDKVNKLLQKKHLEKA